jgi:hypothetical protein
MSCRLGNGFILDAFYRYLTGQVSTSFTLSRNSSKLFEKHCPSMKQKKKGLVAPFSLCGKQLNRLDQTSLQALDEHWA